MTPILFEDHKPLTFMILAIREGLKNPSHEKCPLRGYPPPLPPSRKTAGQKINGKKLAEKGGTHPPQSLEIFRDSGFGTLPVGYINYQPINDDNNLSHAPPLFEEKTLRSLFHKLGDQAFSAWRRSTNHLFDDNHDDGI